MLNEEPKTQTSHTGSYDNDPVSQLLSGLKRVEAPNDFEFRVKAGIAERNSSGGRYEWLPVTWKLVAPMALLLILGGYFGIGSLYPTTDDAALVTEFRPIENAPVIDPAAVIQQPSESINAVPANQVIAENIPLKPVEAVNRNVTVEPQKRAPSRNETENDISGSGSYDEASRESKKIYLPGTDPSGFGANVRKIDVRSAFSTMGITASYSTGGWIVNSASGMAQRSGVRAGDIIEAMNGQPLRTNTSFAGPFTAQYIRVRRDGKSMHLTLR